LRRFSTGDFADKTFTQRANFIETFYKQQARTSSTYPEQFFVYHCRSGYKPAWPEKVVEGPSLSIFYVDGKYYGIKSLKVILFLFSNF
jgi:hypothetical protein